MALVVFVLVVYGVVRTLKTTVQGHSATLDNLVLEEAVIPQQATPQEPVCHKGVCRCKNGKL
jgi:hypothetical protein